MTIVIQIKPEPYCPVCGARMVLHRPKRGQFWNPFWGCNRFPDCKGTRQIDLHTGKAEELDYPIEDYLSRRMK